MSEDDAVEVEPTAESEDGSSEDDVDPEGNGHAGGEETDEAAGEELAESETTLAAQVAEHDEDLAAEVAALESDLAETEAEAVALEAEVEELTSKLARVRADFKNYKERAKRKREEIRERASEALVERITPVRNDLLRALDQDGDSDIRPGVASTLEKFDEVLAEEGVEPIEPEPGDEVDPARHQVMLRVESEQPEGTVHEVYEPGYEMGDRIISEAQVTVSKGSADD
ncbi:nucleotide exchange factor GrpE [Halorubrum vacuolatum]|uniref:Protein GrpE n=1 Tax=Halorubrum vacuolatum TaxID=63740 RepID=A0A238WL93_HALVU|nr:nucleotide exchange factor GrpE [Halorubrum vacuolatum]SNR46459.1 molecular chaperone GrpE [Halorubrum vacuolatum]